MLDPETIPTLRDRMTVNFKPPHFL